MRILRDQGRVAEYQAEVNQHAVAVQRHDVLKHRADRLVITAPATGVVLTLRPQELLGKYVHAGESLVSIAAESSKEIKVSIAESHVESFLEHVGLAAHVYLRGESGSVGPATLVRIDPSATDILRQPLLGAQNGGPLAVQTTDSDAAGPSIRLAAPRFQGIVRVPPDVARHLHAGQLGEVRFSNNSENLGRRLYQWADKWIRRRI
jgi:hypothetical protein